MISEKFEQCELIIKKTKEQEALEVLNRHYGTNHRTFAIAMTEMGLRHTNYRKISSYSSEAKKLDDILILKLSNFIEMYKVKGGCKSHFFGSILGNREEETQELKSYVRSNLDYEKVDWVCSDCGLALSFTDRKGSLSTWHTGICSICGREKGVTESRDFGI